MSGVGGTAGGGPVEVRRATEADVVGIAEVWTGFMDHHAAIDPVFARSDDGHVHFALYVRELLRAPDALVLAAAEGGRVVGYAIAQVAFQPPVFRATRYGFVADLAVAPGYRRRGAGSRLLGEVHRWFASRGIARVEVRVASGNAMGNAFWARHGYREFMRLLHRSV